MARETKRKNAPAMVNSAYLVHLFDIILIKIKKRKKRETDIYFESNSLKIKSLLSVIVIIVKLFRRV